MEYDIMSMKDYALEDLLKILMTKSLVHNINPFHQMQNNSFLGHFVKTGENKYRIMIGSEFDNLMFRGQNKDYDFTSSYSRIINPLDKCIEWIKKEEFKDFFKTTPFYKRLPNELVVEGNEFEFDLEALAQHYEFKTNYLDITKNLNVAMFFAYTTCIDGKYIPIDFQNTDFEPHIYVSTIGQLNYQEPDNFKIVGLQVAERPLLQEAMALDLSKTDNIKNLFTKIPLPKTEYFSYGIYNSFRQGYNLVREDFLTSHVNKIKEKKEIPPELLERYCNETNSDLEALKDELIKNEYIIINSRHLLEKVQIDEMDKKIDNYIKPFIFENIGLRRVVK